MSKQSTSYSALKHTKTTFHFKLSPLVSSFWCEESSLVSGFLETQQEPVKVEPEPQEPVEEWAVTEQVQDALQEVPWWTWENCQWFWREELIVKHLEKALYWELLGVGGVYSDGE